MTTQLAVAQQRDNTRKHYKSPFGFLNRNRLDETVSTDWMYTSVKDVEGRTGAQVFYGVKSHSINVYGGTKESDNIHALDDFGREEGIPAVMRSDNAISQSSNRWLQRLRDWATASEYSEPRQQQQNPVESRAIKWLKSSIAVIRKRTGAPAALWYYIALYVANLHNVCADETLGWRNPNYVRHGKLSDVSVFMHFRFWEKIFYLDSEQSFPSTKELSGYWLGPAKNIGDALTYYIYNDDTERVIIHSELKASQ